MTYYPKRPFGTLDSVCRDNSFRIDPCACLSFWKQEAWRRLACLKCSDGLLRNSHQQVRLDNTDSCGADAPVRQVHALHAELAGSCYVWVCHRVRSFVVLVVVQVLEVIPAGVGIEMIQVKVQNSKVNMTNQKQKPEYHGRSVLNHVLDFGTLNFDFAHITEKIEG